MQKIGNRAAIKQKNEKEFITLVELGLTTKELAFKFKCGEKAIQHTKQRLGIQGNYRVQFDLKDLEQLTLAQLQIKYKYSENTVLNYKKKLKLPKKDNRVWNKNNIIEAFQKFYNIHSRVPQTREYLNFDYLPCYEPVAFHFGSWNKGIIAAGLEPNENDGFGTRIKGLDGILYRSKYETDFSNSWLFNKEEYIYELKYPKPYNLYYDFYLPKRNLYIEIDGGIRPEQIKKKIEINNKLFKFLLVIKGEEIKKFNGFENN